MSQPPLLVHLIFHPASDEARALARTIHRALNGDPAVPGLRVPTVFCPTDGVSPPATYDLDGAQRDFVVVLADYHVVDAYNGLPRTWSAFIGDLWQACEATRQRRFFPVQLDENAWDFDDRLGGINFIRAFAETDPVLRAELVVRRLIIELCRFLKRSPQDLSGKAAAPVTLFLSHTKLDIDAEPKVTHALMDYLDAAEPVKTWFDTGDIDAGSRFAEAIEQGVMDSSLLCVLTDNYSTREWCRKEIILAKRHQRPAVVVAAFSRQEVRSFPYLGNLPVLRWPCIPPEMDEADKATKNRTAAIAAVDLLLKETLRHLHATALLTQVQQEGDFISARPPELLSLAQAKNASAILYPDPPLGSEELDLLTAATAVPNETPLSRLAAERPLKGQRIALSMSESTDIQRVGLDELHFQEAMIELSRYLLLKGATLVYGGNLGNEGYTQMLIELIRAYRCLAGIGRVERIVNTIGWPLPYDDKLPAKYNQVAAIQRIGRPADLDTCPGKEIADRVQSQPFAAEPSPEYRYCWARGMTNMRESQMTKESGIQARIILGGKFGPPANGPGSDEKWYLGRIPGVLEEVALAAQAGQPVFLIGAFGGAAALAIDLLEGRDRTEATWEYQRRAPNTQGMRDLYDRCGQHWWDYAEIVELLRSTGPAGINPLLDAQENRELFHTRNVSRMVELILIGLSRLDERANSLRINLQTGDRHWDGE
jgi:hypothetical protein